MGRYREQMVRLFLHNSLNFLSYNNNNNSSSSSSSSSSSIPARDLGTDHGKATALMLLQLSREYALRVILVRSTVASRRSDKVHQVVCTQVMSVAPTGWWLSSR